MAVVIRAVDFKDNDKVLTLLTKEHGLMSAKVRGAKKQTGKLFASSSLFCCGEYTFYEKNGFFGVRSAHIQYSFGHLQEDYDAYTAACFLADVTGKVAQEDFEAPKLFALLVNALFALDTSAAPPNTVISYFVQRMLLIEGLYPILDHCVYCGNRQTLSHFSISHSGAVCDACKHNDDAINIGVKALAALAAMHAVLPKHIGTIDMQAQTQDALMDMLIGLLEYALQKPLKTTKFVRGCIASDASVKAH